MCCWFFPGRCYFSTLTAGRWQEHSSSRPRSSDCLVVFQLLSVSKKNPKKGQIVKQNCILCLFLNSFYWPWLKTMWDQGKIWRIHKDIKKTAAPRENSCTPQGCKQFWEAIISFCRGRSSILLKKGSTDAPGGFDRLLSWPLFGYFQVF